MRYEDMDSVTDDMLLGDESNSDDALPEGAEDELTEFLEGFFTEDVEKGVYGPGKNPNSHKRKNHGIRLRDAEATVRNVSRGDAAETVKDARKALRDARSDPSLRQRAEDAVAEARYQVRSRRIVRRSMTKGAYAVGKNPASHVRRMKRNTKLAERGRAARLGGGDKAKALLEATQHIVNARKLNDVGLVGGAKDQTSKARAAMRRARGSSVTKGYAVGKNPNSHKKNSGFSARDSRLINSNEAKSDKYSRANSVSNTKGALDQARHAVKAARDAKKDGNLGATSYFAGMARKHTRIARAGNRYAANTDGLKSTKGGAAYGDALNSKAGTKRNAKLNRTARMNKRDGVDVFVPIVKADSKEQIVYGWASPVNELGREITDLQGDVIDVQEVRTAAHEFMMNKRVGGAMHKTFDAGQVVESMVFDADLQKALGIDMPYEGWFIGVKITKADDWAKVVSGEYTGFSIGGSGVREKMEKSQPGAGDVHSAGVAHTKGCVCADCNKKRVKKGYAPGKNPNSHKKSGLANRSGKPTKGTGVTPIEGQARMALRAARKALNEGDKGKASHYAYEARIATRAARSSYNGNYINSKGLTQTEGSKAHNRSLNAAKDASSRMKSARYSKDVENNPAKTRRIVARAMEARANAKKDRALSRMTKREELEKARAKSQYGIGKNPNSHKGKKGGVDMASEGRQVGGKLLLQREESDTYGTGFDRGEKALARYNSAMRSGSAKPKKVGDGGTASDGSFVSAKLPKKKSSFDGGFGAGRKVKTGRTSSPSESLKAVEGRVASNKEKGTQSEADRYREYLKVTHKGNPNPFAYD